MSTTNRVYVCQILAALWFIAAILYETSNRHLVTAIFFTCLGSVNLSISIVYLILDYLDGERKGRNG